MTAAPAAVYGAVPALATYDEVLAVVLQGAHVLRGTYVSSVVDRGGWVEVRGDWIDDSDWTFDLPLSTSTSASTSAPTGGRAPRWVCTAPHAWRSGERGVLRFGAERWWSRPLGRVSRRTSVRALLGVAVDPVVGGGFSAVFADGFELGAAEDAHYRYRLGRARTPSDVTARHLLLHDGAGGPVAVASVHVKGEFAFVSNVTTRVASRGRGHGGRVVDAAAVCAADLGARVLWLQSERNGAAERLYRRHGFTGRFDAAREWVSAAVMAPAEGTCWR